MVVKEDLDTEVRSVNVSCKHPLTSEQEGKTRDMFDGDATYARTDYLSHKSVMSMNASSEIGAKYNNGGEASSTEDCPQEDQQQPMHKHSLSKTTPSPDRTQELQERQHQPYYYDDTHMADAPTSALATTSPSTRNLERNVLREGYGGQGPSTANRQPHDGASLMTNPNSISGNDSDLKGGQSFNQVHPSVSRESAALKEQSQTSGCYGSFTGAAGQKDLYSYRGEAVKNYPLTVPHYGFFKDRTEAGFNSLPTRPPSYMSQHAPEQALTLGATSDQNGTNKPPFDSCQNPANIPDVTLTIKTEPNTEIIQERTTLEQTNSPAKNGDDAPATHSDSGIVHDGGSNTSSNSGSSGDHDDSATGRKSAHSPPDGDRRTASPGELHKTSSALSSPFLTASMTGAASTSSLTSQSASSMGEMKERLAGGPSFPTMPPFSLTPTHTSIPRPNMSSSNPLSLGFLPTGAGGAGAGGAGGLVITGNMTPPRAPLTPGSARSMSPPEIPPVIEGGKEVYFCHLCSYVGNSKFHFNQHMNSHFEHRCPHCDYTSRTEGRLKRHIKDFHSEIPPDNYSGTRTQRTVAPRPKVYKCKQCEFSSMTKIDFWEHSRSHIKDDKVLQCPKCPFVTEYKHHLEYHLRNHFGSKPFKCPKCNYACVNKSMLNSHMKSHTNVYQYRCSDCTYATKYCHSLKLHLKKYNHKPATVLNPDGSLPTDGSGDFELVSKRGPPRGPRGPRKDQPGGPQQMVNPMMMPPMPGMNGLPPPSMMPGYWPMMPPLPNGTMHPPPPLIPASAAHMSPFNPSLASHAQASSFSQERELRESPEMPTSGIQTAPGNGDGQVSGSDLMSSKAQIIKCVLCDFTAEQRTTLNDHMIKVHGAENQDLLNVFCVQPESLAEDQARGAQNSNDGTNKPELSETAATPIKQEDTSSNGQSSPPPANQAWIMNTSQPSARKSSPDEVFPSPMFRSTPQGMPTPHHLDMIQHQLLKERYNAAIAAEIAQNIEAEAKQNGESPLDLTKRKEQFQQQLAAHHIFFNPSFMLPHFQNLQKRKFEEVSMVAMAAAAAGAQEPDSSPPPSDSSMTPRKRSRKGKAYKLDTICQKLQERYGDSPSPGNDSNDGDTSDSAMAGNNMHDAPQSAAPSGGDENEDQIDYGAIHRSLSELNSQMSLDSYQRSPQGEGSREATEAGEQKLSQDQSSSNPSSSLSGLNTGMVNRRKLFMVRHNEQLQQQQQQSREAIEDNNRQSRNSSENASSSRVTGSPESERSSTPPYECNHCAITFRDCIMYTVHMGYHGYQDPFKCNMCGHASTNRVEFFLHIARAAHE